MKLAPLKLGFFFPQLDYGLFYHYLPEDFRPAELCGPGVPGMFQPQVTSIWRGSPWCFFAKDTTGGWPSSPCFLGLLNTSVLNGFESNTHLSTCFFPLKTVEILDLFVGFEKRLVIVKTQSFNNMPCKLTLLFVLFRQSSPHFSVPWIKPNFWGLEGKHPHWEAIRQGGPLPRAIQHPGKATILRYYTYI